MEGDVERVRFRMGGPSQTGGGKWVGKMVREGSIIFWIENEITFNPERGASYFKVQRMGITGEFQSCLGEKWT